MSTNSSDSILTSVKKMVGIDESDTAFDTDIIVHTNTVLTVLTQLGIGPLSGFTIEDASATWNDFLGENIIMLAATKSYVSLRVRTLFDPPTSSAVMDCINRQTGELEWRIKEMAEV